MPIEIGDKVLVSIPYLPFPPPFDSWSNGWKEMLKDVNGTEVEVTNNASQLANVNGIEFDKKGRWMGFIPFIPLQWVWKNSGVTYTSWTNHGFSAIKPSDIKITNLGVKEKESSTYLWCNSCGGSGKHRLMCPVSKAHT